MPDNAVPLNELSKKIIEVVARYSYFPLPILRAQSKRLGKSPETVTADDLPQLAEFIGKSIGDFSNPAKAQEAKPAILNLR